MKQVELAGIIGVTKMTMHKYEKNICEPRAELIGRIADALGTTADFLIGRTACPSPLARDGVSELRRARENELVFRFRRLSDPNKARIEERIDALLDAQTEQGFEK